MMILHIVATFLGHPVGSVRKPVIENAVTESLRWRWLQNGRKKSSNWCYASVDVRAMFGTEHAINWLWYGMWQYCGCGVTSAIDQTSK